MPPRPTYTPHTPHTERERAPLPLGLTPCHPCMPTTMHRTKKIKNMWATPSPTAGPHYHRAPRHITPPHRPHLPMRSPPITPGTTHYPCHQKSSTTPTAPCTPASPHPPSPPRRQQHTATTANKAVALALMHKRLGVHPSVFIRNDPICPTPITPYNSPSHPITPHRKIITLAVRRPSPWKSSPSPLGHMVPSRRCRSPSPLGYADAATPPTWCPHHPHGWHLPLPP